MRKIFFILLVLFAMAGCRKGDCFVIEGRIDGVDSARMVYFEQLTLPEATVLDSTKLGKSGKVKFCGARPDYPELYQLRMGRQRFVFAVDSTERIVFRCSADSLFSPRGIDGSEKTVRICGLRSSVRRLETMSRSFGKGKTSERELLDSITAHKERVKEIVFSDPRSIVSYFALFQQVNGFYMFSPHDKGDRPLCAAVATAYHAFMPDYYRSKNIYNLVLDAIESQRMEDSQSRLKEFIAATGAGFIDISLMDDKGAERHLSDLKGRPVLLDFTTFKAEGNVQYILDLRKVYGEHHAKSGFEIYQVSVDASHLLWEQSVSNLPWVSVRDADGYYARLYNVSRLPTNFLIDASGNIVDRDLTPARLGRKLESMK